MRAAPANSALVISEVFLFCFVLSFWAWRSCACCTHLSRSARSRSRYLILPTCTRRPRTAPSIFLKSLFFASNSLLDAAPASQQRPLYFSSLSFLLRILFWATKAPWRPHPKENSNQNRKTRGRNRALLAGAACTWARSSTVINTERSKPSPSSIRNCMCASLFFASSSLWAAKAPWRPAPMRTRSKKEILQGETGRCWRAPRARGQDQVP